MVYRAWLVILFAPYWLGPLVVWLTQKAGARRVFEPFTPGRHAAPEDVATPFRQTCDALTTEGSQVVADLFQTGQMRHVSTRVALLESPGTAARPAHPHRDGVRLGGGTVPLHHRRRGAAGPTLVRVLS